MPRPTLVFVIALSLATLPRSIGAQTTLAPSSGHLAVRAAGSGSWMLPHSNESLPDQGEFRTSHTGPVHITLGRRLLHVDRNTRLNLDGPNSTIKLFRGRISARLPEGWSIRAGDVVIRPRAGSEVEVFRSHQGLVVVVLSESVEFRQNGGNPVELQANQTLRVKPDGAVGAVGHLKEDQRRQIGLWKRQQPSDGLGQLLVRDPQSGEFQRLEIARYHVHVVLRPPVALVQIDQSFYNPYFRQEEGTFVFNLPQGASVSRFAMFVTPQQLIEGELIERKRASSIYESIVRSRRDPAILEQIGTNLFRMRVFPIFARDTKRILLDYTVPLRSEQGTYHFALPLMSDRKPIWDFQLTGSIHAPVKFDSVRSDTHPSLPFQKGDDGTVTFELKQKNIRPTTGLSLSYREPVVKKPRVRSYIVEGRDEAPSSQFFVATLPPLPKAAVDPRPLDLLILVDTSGSASRLKTSRRIVRTIIENLGPQQRVRLGCVDVDVRPLSKKWAKPTSKETQQAQRFLDEQFSLGATNLPMSLSKAAELFDTSKPERRRSIIYIGDGEPTVAKIDPRWIDTFSATGITFTAIRVGGSDGKSFLRETARATGGRLFETTPADSRRFFGWLLDGMPSAARIESLAASGVETADLFHDSSWIVGESRLIYGRCRPRKKLRITCQVTGRPKEKFKFKLSRKNNDEDVFVGRLWAQRKIERLLREEVSDNASRKEQIVRLAQEWSLMSPHTAFLVLETEKEYARYGIDRRLRHRYWRPVAAADRVPLPEQLKQFAGAQVKPARGTPQWPEKTVDRETFATELKAARDALAKNEPAQALLHLLRISRVRHPANVKKYSRLLRDVRQRLSNDAFLAGLGLHRSLVQRSFMPSQRESRPQLFAMSFGGISPGLLESHPQARSLLKQIRVTQPRMKLKQLREFVRKATGTNLLIDETALDEEGISLNEEIDVTGLGRITLRNFLYYALNDLGLTFYEEPHMLTVTTEIDAEEILRTRTYRVVDLVRTDVLPDATQLFSPFADVVAQAEFRLTNKLQRRIDVEFEGLPLNEVMDWFRGKLNDNLIVDRTALEEEGIAADEPVTLSLKSVPLRVALDHVGQPLGLTWTIDREALRVTTEIQAEALAETRVYPAVGLVYEMPFEHDPAPWRHFGGVGLFGGMGGFGGGGLGGFGGAVGGLGGFGFGGGLLGGSSQGASAASGFSDIIDPRELKVSVDSQDAFGGSGGSGADFDSLIELIQTETGTTEPFDTTLSLIVRQSQSVRAGIDTDLLSSLMSSATSGPWAEYEGEGGTVNFHRPSMSIVVLQTDKVHREIKELFLKLRGLPVAAKNVRRVRLPRIGPESPAGWDMLPLIELIQNTTWGPWAEYDGEGGTIQEFLPAMALTISQTQRVHEQIEQLLANLRRARYVAETVPATGRWDAPDLRMLFLELATVTRLKTGTKPPRSAALKKELELLAVRKADTKGAAVWSYHRRHPRETTRVGIRWNGDRLELRDNHRLLRAVGDHAAAAYPELGLVEIDRWGRAVRERADAYLPWLPHRSNEELARLFEIDTVSKNAEGTTLRFTFPGGRENHLRVRFANSSGLPTEWSAYVKGQLQYRLVFKNLVTDPRPNWEKVVALDADGREIERWEFISLNDSGAIRNLKQGWSGYVIDNRLQAEDSAYQKIRRAIRELRGDDALRLVKQELARRPGCPLNHFLLAWIYEYGGFQGEEVRLAKLEALEQVADSAAVELIQLIEPRNFASLSDRQVYDVLLRQPITKRTARNWEVLAGFAAALGKPEVSLQYLARAVGMTPRRFSGELQRQRIDLLLGMNRIADAGRDAQKCVEQIGPEIELLAQLGDLFASHKQEKTARRFYQRCFKSIKTSSERRLYYVRFARWLKGAPRWRLLLLAAQEMPRSSYRRESQLQRVISEMRTGEDAPVAARLAKMVTDSAIRRRLLIRQVELTADPDRAADLCLKLFATTPVPQNRLSWVIKVLNAGERNREVVRILERHLRNQGRLNRDETTVLVRAYNRLNRLRDANRAATDRLDRPSRRDDQSAWGMTGAGFFSIGKERQESFQGGSIPFSR